MATATEYTYQAVDQSGKKVTGKLEAMSSEAAVHQLLTD